MSNRASDDRVCEVCDALVMDMPAHLAWHTAERLRMDDDVVDLLNRVNDLEDDAALEAPRTRRARTPDESYWRCMPVGIWFWYCETHDAHGSAGSKEEAEHVSGHHARYFKVRFTSPVGAPETWKPCQVTISQTTS